MIETLFGSGKHLDALQMGMRALVLFFITLVLVRAAGMRAFGRKSPFDTILVITLGAVLSRAITGASPFWPTLAASTVLVILHRAVATLAVRSETFERWIKGEPTTLYDDGRIDDRAMLLSGISRHDLDEATRKQANKESFEEVERITIETSGELTVVDQKSPRERSRLSESRRPPQAADGAVGAPHRAAPARFRR